MDTVKKFYLLLDRAPFEFEATDEPPEYTFVNGRIEWQNVGSTKLRSNKSENGKRAILFPETGGSGANGIICRNDTWIVNALCYRPTGSFDTAVSEQTFRIQARVDHPGQDFENWKFMLDYFQLSYLVKIVTDSGEPDESFFDSEAKKTGFIIHFLDSLFRDKREKLIVTQAILSWLTDLKKQIDIPPPEAILQWMDSLWHIKLLLELRDANQEGHATRCNRDERTQKKLKRRPTDYEIEKYKLSNLKAKSSPLVDWPGSFRTRTQYIEFLLDHYKQIDLHSRNDIYCSCLAEYCPHPHVPTEKSIMNQVNKICKEQNFR